MKYNLDILFNLIPHVCQQESSAWPLKYSILHEWNQNVRCSFDQYFSIFITKEKLLWYKKFNIFKLSTFYFLQNWQTYFICFYEEKRSSFIMLYLNPSFYTSKKFELRNKFTTYLEPLLMYSLSVGLVTINSCILHKVL